MELTLRDWLLILGSIFILVLLVHGYMRARKNTNSLILDESLLRAQTAKGTEASDLEHASRRVQAAFDELRPDEALYDEAVHEKPLHEEPAQQAPSSHERSAKEMSSADMFAKEMPSNGVSAKDMSFKRIPAKKSPSNKSPANKSPADKTQHDPSASVASDAPPQAGIPEKIVQIHVLALDEPFTGPRLSEVLTASGLVFGEMDIFHRLDAQGRVEFSLASALEPGSFDQSSIEDFTGPGLILFMRVHELSEPLRVFDDLLAVAQAIALELYGEVKDETRSVMTPQTIDHYRQVIKDFQFKYLT